MENTIPAMDSVGFKSLKSVHGAAEDRDIQKVVQKRTVPKEDLQTADEIGEYMKVDATGTIGRIDTPQDTSLRQTLGQRRFDITLHHRWILDPDAHTRRWVPAGFDAYTWLHLDPSHFQILGHQAVAIGVGGRGSSDDEQDETPQENQPLQTTDALVTFPQSTWHWQTRHVRVIYREREWILNERSVSEILTVLKATDAIPQRVIGFRDNRRVQRTDRLQKGDVLYLVDVPKPAGHITISCEGDWDDQAFQFKITGETLRMEELVRSKVWEQHHIEDAMYWVRLKSRPNSTDLTELYDGDIVQVKARRADQRLKHADNAELIRTVEARMGQEYFFCTAPLLSIERLIRERLRMHYGRTDATYIL
jgi:hypothetical protein